MKRLLLSFLLLAASVACGEEVRVLTFNIRYDNPNDGPDTWVNRRESVAKLITEAADIAGLQEVKPQQRTWLIEQLPAFGLVGIGREPEDKDESVPVVFRKDRFELLASGTFLLSDTPETPGSASFGNKLPRICTWAKLRDRKGEEKDAPVWFYNVHLDHQSRPARERGIALVLERMAAREGGGPVLLVGDFNSTLADAPCKKIATHEKPVLISTYDALGVRPEGTFHAFTGTTRYGAIDFIYAEKERWTIKSGEVLKTTYAGTDGKQRYVSDHFPVRATVNLR